MNQTRCAGLALGLSGVCLLLWRWIWNGIYDPDTQMVYGNGQTTLFYVFVALCGLILLLLSRGRLHRAPGWGSAGVPGKALRLLSGLCALAAGAALLLSAPDGMIPIALAVLLLLDGAARIALALRGGAGSARDSLVLLPAFVSCYWLVAFYHEYDTWPSYVTCLWPMLAGLLTVWSWLTYAGRSYQPRKTDPALPLALLTVLFIGPGLASPLSVGYRLSLCAQMSWFLSVALETEPVSAPIRKENSNV